MFVRVRGRVKSIGAQNVGLWEIERLGVVLCLESAFLSAVGGGVKGVGTGFQNNFTQRK